VWIRRVARALSILVIAFTLVMAVGHLFESDPYTVEDYPPIENVLPVMLFFSVVGLAIAWRWEGIGGAINVGLWLATMGLDWIIRGEPIPIMAVPLLFVAIVPGILFLVCWWRGRRGLAA
jgi:hypothetical protein